MVGIEIEAFSSMTNNSSWSRVPLLGRAIDWFDRFQRRSAGPAVIVSVGKKFARDRGGMLAALMAYYGFLSLFPLLLLLITVVGLLTGGNASAIQRVEHSALSRFPVVGSHLAANIRSIHNRAGVGLAVGIVGLLWGSRGVVRAGQHAMAQIWYVPIIDRPRFVAKLVRSLVLIGLVGGLLLVTTALTGVVTVGGRTTSVFAATALTLFGNVVIYAVAFRILTPGAVPWRRLWPGAVLGGTGWTVLQYAGGALVDHFLRNTNQIYGFFAIVLGLMVWISLGCQLSLYAAEFNVVLSQGLWPCGLRASLTAADRRMLEGCIHRERSHEDERIAVSFVNPESSVPDG